jgi:hypothetical protein
VNRRRFAYLLSPWILALVPFSTLMPAYLEDAKSFAATSRIANDFRPICYALLISVAFRAAGIGGIIVFQSVVYIATVPAALHLARRICDVPGFILLATSLVAFHPYLLVDMKRVTDNAIDVLGTLVLVAFLFLRRQVSTVGMAGLGIVLAIMFTSRPNALVFGLIPGVATCIDQLPISRLFTTAATFIATWMIISVIATTYPFYLPDNGPYSLFAGSNQFIQQVLLTDLNAEPSIGPALAAAGATASDRAYLTLSLSYAVGHPIAWIGLLALKVFTLFRPDWRLAEGIGKVLLQSVLALPVLVWLLVALKSRAHWDTTHYLFLPFLALYVAPFALTNSDPRFRLSLDVSFLLDAVRRLASLSLGTAELLPISRFFERA